MLVGQGGRGKPEAHHLVKFFHDHPKTKIIRQMRNVKDKSMDKRKTIGHEILEVELAGVLPHPNSLEVTSLTSPAHWMFIGMERNPSLETWGFG